MASVILSCVTYDVRIDCVRVHLYTNVCVYICICMYVYMHHLCDWDSWRSEEDVRSPGTGVMICSIVSCHVAVKN